GKETAAGPLGCAAFDQGIELMTIKLQFNKLLLAGAATAMLIATPGLAANINGLITARNGNVLTVVDGNNVSQTVNLTPTTQIRSTSGVLEAQRTAVEPTALIPGLRVSITPDASGSTATAISFRASDLRTAQSVAAGVATTEEQAATNAANIAANKNRLNDFGTNVTLATADVLFASGSTAISAQGKSDLRAFAKTALATNGYQVTVNGYTDSTGNAANNQRLSKARANAVINFLQQNAGLSTSRVQSGNGMGVASDAGDGSNAGARRVTVRLFVDKGVADKGSN
ncbi:MAG: OmpA family protein, partial [Polymorphobacter sp.]